ncbi:MAG: hypothetical protein P8Q42_12375 [Flavobacteriales bacterium]|nr:hypothetical protein [Flavobacteriales bacterium]|tara:strand:+ start:205 stop:1062 length:858 start_codon:yes stop_codon:yes gene_type:complete
MSNFSEIISQLRNNQEAFEAKLSKVEDLGANVSETVLRDLIQNSRELHEGTVILSYVVFNESNNTGEQLEIPLELAEKESSLPKQESVSEEEELMNALDQALEHTEKDVEKSQISSEFISHIKEVREIINEEEGEGLAEEEVAEEAMLTESEIIEETKVSVEEESPSQEQLTDVLEDEILSMISMHSSIASSEVDDEDNSLAAKLAKTKIENLNSVIGINEKFLFTNELFDGNTEQFLKTISDLNNCESISEANSKLAGISTKRNWNQEEEPFQKFQLLLHRKYQ